MRYRNKEVSESVRRLEERVNDQAAQLERMNRSDSYDYHHGIENVQQQTLEVSDEDIERELQEIRELERRKRALEDRVTGMERDLGGLLR